MSNLAKNIRDLFGHVFVVSLKRSTERRKSLASHFADLNIDDYSFFDATDSSDPLLEAWLSEGKVHQYPPCFRCGKLNCGKTDCNNVLMPPQIATFLSHQRLWRHIYEGGHDRALVVEDDVRFHPWAARVLEESRNAIREDSSIFDPSAKCLLRLGWALNEEHADSQFATMRDVRMSNPCYALTRAASGHAAEMAQRIDTTVDIFLHINAANEFDSAVTVFPPIASELSWSTGEVRSEIHPKTLHLDHLRNQGKDAEADQYSAQMLQHVAHISHCELLLTGHPRCGSKFASDVCRAVGLNVGHEAFEPDGISSWMFAVDENPVAFFQNLSSSSRQRIHWNRLVQFVRNPFTAIPSIMVDDAYSSTSREFRRRHILEHTGVDLDDVKSPIERAAWSLLYWTKIVADQEPDVWFQIEAPTKFLKYLKTAGLIPETTDIEKISVPPSNVNKPYDDVVYPKPRLKPVDFSSMSESCRLELARYCCKYGYSYEVPGFRKAGLENFGTEALKPIGWFKSLETEIPLTAEGAVLPWFTYGSIEFLAKVVRDTDRVFEYGSGWSTVWWAENAFSVVSVEHDERWVQKILPNLPGNADLKLVTIDSPACSAAQDSLQAYLATAPRETFDYPAERRIARGLEDRRFAAYAHEIARRNETYDIVVIDGVARRLCTHVATAHCADDGIIVFDNTNRSDYREAYAYLARLGFRQINFWGPVPGEPFNSCTSIFLRSLDRIPAADFNPSILGIKEF